MAMAKTLWFQRRGHDGVLWYRCGLCREYRKRADGGHYLCLGTTQLAVVCYACSAAARLCMAEHVPHSWPDVDDRGVLLYDPDAS